MQSHISIRVKKRRDTLRASGLRPIQIWVPDTRKEGFAEECHRQSKSLQKDAHEQKLLEWIASVADTSND